MRQILFVQGGGKDVHDQWDNTLVESLRRELGAGYEIRYPRMPNEADPKFGEWRAAVESEIAALDGGAIVVGHSIGGTVLINALAERTHGVHLGAIILLAAPFVGEGGWESDDISLHADLGARLPAGVPVSLYHGEKDETAPISHVRLYAAAIPLARVRRLAGRDHQLHDDLANVAGDIRGLER
ncbi:MAG: alpha/beta fold hydrolase [Gemmatimonadaceae bacterium]|nr:alpha/beta fold hydrolase [Gemmatimonadaceae bacterium]